MVQDAIQNGTGDATSSDSAKADTNTGDSSTIQTDAKSTVPVDDFRNFQSLAEKRYSNLDGQYQDLKSKYDEALGSIDGLNVQIKRLSEDETRGQRLERLEQEQRNKRELDRAVAEAKKEQLHGAAYRLAGEYSVDATTLLDMTKGESVDVKDLEIKAVNMAFDKVSNNKQTVAQSSSQNNTGSIRPTGPGAGMAPSSVTPQQSHARAIEADPQLAALFPELMQ